MYTYRAKIIAVYDGDTVTAKVDLGFNVTLTEKFRLYGINAPEVRGDGRDLGLMSRDALRELILGKEVTINTIKDRKGKYGRYLAIILLDEENVNDWLVTKGFAVYHTY